MDIPTLALDVSPRDGSRDVGESTDTQTRWSSLRNLNDIGIEALEDAIR
ncbi:MAG: hypothetical protein Q7R22_003160 [Verrucomicrobiota bacterium JB025]|nr:hypothetical protein [Verrucomicrobiota bacterium JB025]